jgi:nucleoside-diphosphate-sugar epimerase
LEGEKFRMTAGEQTREYTYIDDVVDGFLRAGSRAGGEGEVYNLGSGEEISLRGLVKKVEGLLGRKIEPALPPLPYRKNEIWRFVGDHGKAARRLGWRATVALECGLKKLIQAARDGELTGFSE